MLTLTLTLTLTPILTLTLTLTLALTLTLTLTLPLIPEGNRPPAGGAGPIAAQNFKFSGIRNGIDFDMWDTENNMFLTQGYDAEHVVEVGWGDGSWW